MFKRFTAEELLEKDISLGERDYFPDYAEIARRLNAQQDEIVRRYTKALSDYSEAGARYSDGKNKSSDQLDVLDKKFTDAALEYVAAKKALLSAASEEAVRGTDRV